MDRTQERALGGGQLHRQHEALTEPLTFDVDDVMASDVRAVIVGELATRIKATDKVVETAFAIVLTISGDQILRFQMLEDSFAVSLAARVLGVGQRY